MGVWIETLIVERALKLTASLLMWECGLKHEQSARRSYSLLVTPYVGVWIETRVYCQRHFEIQVTPYVGVWIETGRHLRK